MKFCNERCERYEFQEPPKRVARLQYNVGAAVQMQYNPVGANTANTTYQGGCGGCGGK